MKRLGLMLLLAIVATVGLYSTSEAGCTWNFNYYSFPTTDGEAGTTWSNCPDQGTLGANVEFYREECSPDPWWYTCSGASSTRIYPSNVQTIGAYTYYTFQSGFANGTFDKWDRFVMQKRVNGSVVESVSSGCRALYNPYDEDFLHCESKFLRP